MRETKAVLKNNNERERGLIKISTYGNVDWMLLIFDLAYRELRSPVEERMPFHGFLHKAASPTLREPRRALNPVHTLPVVVGREQRLIWRKSWFTLQVETGVIHPWEWEQRFGADMKIVLLLVASTAVLLYTKRLPSPLLAHFPARPWWPSPLQHPLQPLLPVPVSRSKLKAVLCNLANESRKRLS